MWTYLGCSEVNASMIANRGGQASTSHSQTAFQLRRPCSQRSSIRAPLKRQIQVSCETSRDSTHLWRQYYRFLRYQKAGHLPRVSWERYHLSVIFVDRTDTVRAKVAAGIFDRIANWNGYGRALYPTTAGVDVSGQTPDITTSAGLMSQAGLLKIPPKLFSRPGQQFEVEDLDRNDIILASDMQTKLRLESILCTDVPDCTETMSRVALLTDFKAYAGSSALLQSGGSALLEPELKQIIEPVLADARQAQEINSPTLKQGSQEWNSMVQITVCCAAGLVQFLIDAWPPDLPDYDPV